MSPPPVTAPPAPPSAPIAAAPKELPVDTTAVPEPPGLILVGRVSRPNAIISAAASWTRLPLPTGADLLRSLMDDDAADVVDLSQPVDAAMIVTLGPRMKVTPLTALSIGVTSFDEAKVKLGARHRLVPGVNGVYNVGNVRPRGVIRENDRGDEHDDEGDVTCSLAHAPSGARLVCGESAALEALVPYLSRTVSREKWNSDIHLELHPEPVRAPLAELRGSIPLLARGLMGNASPAVSALIDSCMGEALDIVNDTQRLALDAQIADSGVVATSRFELQSKKSVFARMLTMPERADATPPAFWHLPAETDLAFYGRGSDPKLFEHPRELIANLLLEATDSSGMPEAERKLVKDLVADRMLSLFTNGPGLYAKGYDEAAVVRASKARQSVKPDDVGGISEAKRALAESVVGWHLYQVNEPLAKVGPVLKDWSSLWNRPAFVKWAQSKSSKQKLSHMRIAPPPAGVALPKDAVHLEVTIPRDDIEIGPPHPAGLAGRPNAKKPPPGPAPKPKTVAQKPILFHIFAVPDGASTWLAFGLDAKLVAEKAAASLAAAPEAKTLGKGAAGLEALREAKLNLGGFATLRSFLVFTALDGDEPSKFNLLSALPGHGATPVVITGRAEAPSPAARGGASTGQIHLPRAVIEDIVKLVAVSR